MRVMMSNVTVVQKLNKQDAAQHHQRQLKAIEGAPLQVTLPPSNQLDRDGHSESRLGQK